MSRPFPGTVVASTNSTSPPAIVAASPVATPTSSFSSASSQRNRGCPRNSERFSSPTVIGSVSPLATRRATPRQIAPSSRPRPRTPPPRLWGRPGPGTAAGDLQLLALRVAGQFDDRHAVTQGSRDRVLEIGGGNEEDLREVERHVQVVVAEGVVLRRV